MKRCLRPKPLRSKCCLGLICSIALKGGKKSCPKSSTAVLVSSDSQPLVSLHCRRALVSPTFAFSRREDRAWGHDASAKECWKAARTDPLPWNAQAAWMLEQTRNTHIHTHTVILAPQGHENEKQTTGGSCAALNSLTFPKFCCISKPVRKSNNFHQSAWLRCRYLTVNCCVIQDRGRLGQALIAGSCVWKLSWGAAGGVTVGPGNKPNCVASLSDEIHAWRLLQKQNYSRQDRIQWTAWTTQLLPVCISTEQRAIFYCKKNREEPRLSCSDDCNKGLFSI